MIHVRLAVARFLLCILLLGLPVLAPASARAQEAAAGQPGQVSIANDWTPGSAIPQYAPSTLPPAMVADQNRTVHALASLPLTDDPSDPASEEIGIFYRQWTLDGGWTKPNDIMLTPIKRQARVKSVFLDEAGVMHMVFYGGDEQEANTYYTWAPAAQASSASAWSAPQAVGPAAIAPEVAAISGDGDQHLVVLYSGDLGEGNSLYVVYSDDAGVTWSEPVLLFSTYSADKKVFDFNIFKSAESGKLYVVWNVTDEQGQNVAGYYAYLDGIASRRWSEPKIIAPSVGLGFANPNLIEYQGSVFIIYNNGLEGQTAPVLWFVRSDNGGLTFSAPIRPFPDHIGRNGPVSFVVDGNGVLHAFFGQRIGGGLDGVTDLHGMWHSIWQNGNWGPVRPIVTGPISSSFDPYDATAVVSQGNVILLTWRTDPGREIRSTFYAYQVLDAPEAPAVPLPTLSIVGPVGLQAQLQAEMRSELEADLQAEQDATPTVAPGEAISGDGAQLPAPTPLPQFSRLPAPDSAGNPAMPLVSALAPTMLFIVAALLFGAMRRSGRSRS